MLANLFKQEKSNEYSYLVQEQLLGETCYHKHSFTLISFECLNNQTSQHFYTHFFCLYINDLNLILHFPFKYGINRKFENACRRFGGYCILKVRASDYIIHRYKNTLKVRQIMHKNDLLLEQKVISLCHKHKQASMYIQALYC